MALTNEQIMRIRTLLRCVWKNVMPDSNAISVWSDSLRGYDFETVETACKKYIASSRFQPNPADIIFCIPAKVADATQKYQKYVAPQYEEINGSLVKTIKCRRCNDTGLITWDDDKQCTYGKPCTCEAGLANYGGKNETARVD